MRLRTPRGISRAGRLATGGRALTRVPRRPRAEQPRVRRERYAAATVVGLTVSAAANARTVGNIAPCGIFPERMPSSTLAIIALASRPAIEYCNITFTNLYCNKKKAYTMAQFTHRQNALHCTADPHVDPMTTPRAAILDEALYCHVGFIVDGQPYVIPAIHARVDEQLIFTAPVQAACCVR
jgi:hypothetical protein